MPKRMIPALALFAAPLTGYCQDTKSAVPPAAAAAAEKRTLVFHRPETKGAKYEITAKASVSRTIDYRSEGDVQPGGGDSVEGKLEGVLEVTEVSPKAGNITAYTFTIKKMSLVHGTEPDEGLEPGTVITAKLVKSQPAYFVNGGEVVDKLKTGLGMVMPALSTDDVADSEGLAPAGPVAPGDTWDQDKKKLAAYISKSQDAELDPAASKAAVTYKGAATVSGIDADNVAVSNDTVFSSIKGLPAEAKLTDCRITMNITYALAREAKITLPLSARTVFENATRYTIQHEGKDIQVEYKSSGSATQSAKPVK